MRFPLGEMTVGDILDRGLRVLLARLPVFYALHLIVLFPLITVQVAAPLILFQGSDSRDVGAAMAFAVFGLFALFISLILQPIATAAILHIVMEEYAGRRASLASALGFAVSRFLPLLGASILVGLLVLLGVFLCCIPGIYFWITYIFVGQAVVLEKLGVSEAFQRSQRLITGFWWRVFGVLLLVLIAQRIVQVGLEMGLSVALPPQEVIPTQNGEQIKVNPLNHIIDTLAAQLVAILFASYTAVCTTLLYLDLRIRKEGFDLELAAGGGPERDDRDRYDRDYRDRDRYDDRDQYDDRDRDRYEDDYDNRDDRGRRRAQDRDYYDDRDRPVHDKPEGERTSEGEQRPTGENAHGDHEEPPRDQEPKPEHHEEPPRDRGPEPEQHKEPPPDDRDRR